MLTLKTLCKFLGKLLYRLLIDLFWSSWVGFFEYCETGFFGFFGQLEIGFGLELD